MQITNTSESAVNNWEVCWEYAGDSKRTSGWNANVNGSSPWCASGVGWNNTIQPGQSVEFGIQGTKSNSTSPTAVITSCKSQ